MSPALAPCLGPSVALARAHHEAQKSLRWDDPTAFGPPSKGNGLIYRTCRACGSTLAIEDPATPEDSGGPREG